MRVVGGSNSGGEENGSSSRGENKSIGVAVVKRTAVAVKKIV
jgi:hypothetical protein